GAAIPSDHEGSGAFAPAFPMVRAARAFADSVKAEVFQEPARLEKGVVGGQLQAQPLGQARAGCFSLSSRRGRRGLGRGGPFYHKVSPLPDPLPTRSERGEGENSAPFLTL